MKQQDKIIEFVAEKEGESAGLSRKNMRVADDTLLDKSLYLWFTQESTKGTPISGWKRLV